MSVSTIENVIEKAPNSVIDINNFDYLQTDDSLLKSTLLKTKNIPNYNIISSLLKDNIKNYSSFDAFNRQLTYAYCQVRDDSREEMFLKNRFFKEKIIMKFAEVNSAIVEKDVRAASNLDIPAEDSKSALLYFLSVGFEKLDLEKINGSVMGYLGFYMFQGARRIGNYHLMGISVAREILANKLEEEDAKEFMLHGKIQKDFQPKYCNNSKSTRLARERKLVTSLNDPINGSENLNYILDSIQDEEKTPDESLELKLFREELYSVMEKTLTSREFDIIDKRFFEDYSLEEIGHEYNLTRERIRQLQKKAIRKLSIYFNSVGINNFEDYYSS